MFSGSCAAFHGYDRTITLKIEGDIDQYGWVFPFGAFKAVRKWLEYYFDHTALISADDPRLEKVLEINKENKLFNLRILPLGVSMEMTCLFLYGPLNNYIFATTGGRCSLVEIECREHEKNAGNIIVDRWEARNMSMNAFGISESQIPEYADRLMALPAEANLIEDDTWEAIDPRTAFKEIQAMMYSMSK